MEENDIRNTYKRNNIEKMVKLAESLSATPTCVHPI